MRIGTRTQVEADDLDARVGKDSPPSADRGGGPAASRTSPPSGRVAVEGTSVSPVRSPSPGRWVDRAFLIWLATAAAILLFLELVAYTPIYLYFFVWTLGVGIPLFVLREAVRTRVRSILVRSPLARFLVLGALMVLAEETVAALVNSMKEGFSISLWLHRIPQFWLFNLLVFVPLFLGWYVVARHLPFTLRETLYLTGAVGIYSEHILGFWLTDPVVAAVFTPVEMATYAVIALPAMLSIPLPAPVARNWPTWARYAALLVLPVVFAGVGAGLAEGLRGLEPGWFPPRSEIP